MNIKFYSGLGVHVDFVRSVALDEWTRDQIEMMKAGGNDKCKAYFEEHKLPPDSTLKERYTSEIANEYKKVVAAAAQGEAPPVTSSLTPTSNDDDGDSMSLQKIAQLEEPMTYYEAYLPYLGLLITFLTRSLSLPTIGIPYLALGISTYFIAPNHEFLRQIWWTSLVLPPLAISGCYVYVVRTLVTNRQPAFKSAQNLLWERIQSGRAKRLEEYDIYLPPPSETNESSTLSKQGLIFFPGALVSHTAYAPLAAKLSDAGIVVVLMSLEPTRISLDVSTCHKRALLVMYEVLTLGLDISVDEWNLGGHAMGGSMAMALAAKMAPSKLVLCGIGRVESEVPPALKSSTTQALVMNGTEDPYANGNKEKWEEFQAFLPPAKGKETAGKGFTEYTTIEGGNHSGFAHYGPQTHPRPDGVRKITMEEQQDAFVQKTVEFIFATTTSTAKKKD